MHSVFRDWDVKMTEVRKLLKLYFCSQLFYFTLTLLLCLLCIHSMSHSTFQFTAKDFSSELTGDRIIEVSIFTTALASLRSKMRPMEERGPIMIFLVKYRSLNNFTEFNIVLNIASKTNHCVFGILLQYIPWQSITWQTVCAYAII